MDHPQSLHEVPGGRGRGGAGPHIRHQAAQVPGGETRRQQRRRDGRLLQPQPPGTGGGLP